MAKRSSDDEVSKRVEAVLKGAFSGPPTPLKDIPKKSKKSRKSSGHESGGGERDGR